MGLGGARSPAAKHFDAIYTVKQLSKIRIDVYGIPGTEISVHATVCRTDTMDYKPCRAAWH